MAKIIRAYRTLRRTAVQVWREFSLHDGPQAAAAFSFFCFLSLLALAIFSGAVLGTLLNNDPRLLQRIIDYLAQNAPGFTGTVSDALRASMNLSGLLGIGGALGLLFTGTRVADSLQVWLSEIYGTEKPRFLKKKARSLLILGFAALMGALGFGIHVTFILAGRWLKWLSVFAGVFAYLLSSLVLFAAASFIYSISLETKPGWRSVRKGAFFTALLVNPVQLALTWFYSNLGDHSIIYGSFAGIVITVVTIYYAGYIIFLGAELNRCLEVGARPGEAEEKPGPVEATGDVAG